METIKLSVEPRQEKGKGKAGRLRRSGKVPGTFSIRRSDDILRYNCTTDSGKTGIGGIASSIEGAKLGASVLFFDLGITDAITDKHRTYAPSFTIPVN